jgi:uncharacterized protein with HEPN domain
MPVSSRDKKTLLQLIEQAQLVYLLTRYPKKRVLDDAEDVKRLEDGLEGMRAAAKTLPASLKEKHGMIPWDELAEKPDTPDLAWRRAKRISPTAIRELLPLLEGEPEAAFFVRPEAAKTKATAKSSPPRTKNARRSVRRD